MAQHPERGPRWHAPALPQSGRQARSVSAVRLHADRPHMGDGGGRRPEPAPHQRREGRTAVHHVAGAASHLRDPGERRPPDAARAKDQRSDTQHRDVAGHPRPYDVVPGHVQVLYPVGGRHGRGGGSNALDALVPVGRPDVGAAARQRVLSVAGPALVQFDGDRATGVVGGRLGVDFLHVPRGCR